MAVVIRLMRAGAKKRPFYRMVAADSRRQRDGRFLEILGHYNPLSQPFELVVQRERVEEWIGKGATTSEQAASLLRSLGIKMQNASKPQKEAGAAKKTAKRAVKRVVSERKLEKRARKTAAKKGGKAYTPKRKTPIKKEA
jgi:small subunit ribosomal protein S16